MEIYKIIFNGDGKMGKKKIVLITGGASGIGFGTIEYLLEQRNYEIISVSRGEKNIALAKEKLRDNVNRKEI